MPPSLNGELIQFEYCFTDDWCTMVNRPQIRPVRLSADPQSRPRVAQRSGASRIADTAWLLQDDAASVARRLLDRAEKVTRIIGCALLPLGWVRDLAGRLAVCRSWLAFRVFLAIRPRAARVHYF